MTINISQEDTILFENNGFTYDDVKNTIDHYRQSGLSDNDIQNKINQRIATFKQAKVNPDGIRNLKDIPTQMYAAPERKAPESKAPERNLFTDMSNAFKWAAQLPFAAFETQKKNMEIATLEAKSFYGKQTENDRRRIAALDNQSSKYQLNANNNYGIKDKKYKNDASTVLGALERTPQFIKKSYATTMEQIPLLWETMKSGGVGSVAGGIAGGVVGGGSALVAGQLGPQAASPEEIVTVPSATLAGARQGALWGGRVGASKKVFEIEGGLARHELKQINEEIIASGGTPLTDDEINLYAIAVGGANAGLEMFSLNQLLKTVPGGKAILDKLKKHEVKELVNNPTVRQKMNDILKEYGKSILTEGLTEAAQEATMVVAGERARKLGGLENTPLEQNVSRIIESGMMGAGAAIFLGGVGTVSQTALVLRNKGVPKQQAEEQAQKMSLDERVDYLQENEDTLLSAATQTSEEQFENRVKSFSEKLVSSGQVTDNQTAEKFARMQLNLLSNLSEKTNKSLDELIEDDAAEIQVSDEEEYIDDTTGLPVDAIIDQRIDELTNELVSLPDDYADETDMNNRQAEIDLLGKINSGEKLSLEEMEAANDLIENYEQNGDSSFADTLKNAMENPVTHFQRANIAGAQQNEIATAQKEWKEKGTESKYFKKWFGNSKVVDENGKPLKLTDDKDIYISDEYSNNGISRYSNNGQEQKQDLYLSIQNPKYQDKLPENRKDAKKLRDEGYDGVITSDGKYLVFEKMQIKSDNNQGIFDRQNQNIYYQKATTNHQEQFENIQANRNYKQFVNKVFDNKLSKQEKSKPFQIGKTPDKLIQAGFPDNNISIGHKIIEKAQDNRNPDHNLSKETIREVYQALDNPIAVIKAEQNKNEKTPNNRYSVVLNLKEKGHYILVAFEINKKDGNTLLNDIRSIHSRKDYTPLIDKAFNENRLIKIDRDKIKDLLTPKIQPDIISGGVASLIDSIYQQTNNVKFFQSAYKRLPSDYSYIHNQVTGEKIDIEMNEDIKVDKIEPQEISLKLPFEVSNKTGEDADESTIIHELAHWWLEKLRKYAQESEEIQQDLEEIRKLVKNNGEPFTTEQHERFARAFEVYMRTGSAKTNRLKKLFEDFKNVLLSLYDSIKELGFNEDEIPAINRLFDRLLTTENQRIQSAVFDRCDNLQQQIEEIKADQEKEFADIDEIYDSNLERDLQQRRTKQQVEEYLNQAYKSAGRLPESVKNYQKRYKRATYEILSTALGGKYSPQYIMMTLEGNPKSKAMKLKQEKLREMLYEASDQITASGGMKANWLEFYQDSGVSYENDEIDGDYKVVEQALQTVDNGTYLPPEIYEGEREIAKFFGMFDYLSNKVLTLKGENKNAAFEALTSIFDDMPMMPDEATQDLLERLDKVTESFIGQKVNEKSTTKVIPNTSLSVQYRSYITQKLHNMKAYDPGQKRYIRLSEVNKLYTVLKFATDKQSAKNIVRQINSYAIQQIENRQKAILHKEIQRQVKINSKLIKVGALKRGKFDWKTNTVFSDLREMNRLPIEDARKELNKLINADSAILSEERESIEQNPTSNISAPTDLQAIIKIQFLEYKANKIKDMNLAATRSLLENLLQLKFEGRRAKSVEELNKALSRENYKTNLVDTLDINKDNKLAKYAARWVAGDTIFTSEGTLANWESLVNAIFNKNIAQECSLLKYEADVEVYARKKTLELYNKAREIYGLGKNTVNKGIETFNKILDFDNIQPVLDLLRQYEDKGHTYQFSEITYNKDTGEFVKTKKEITHGQLIVLYGWHLNPELKKRAIVQFVGEPENNNYTEYEKILDDLMLSKLSEQDKEFAYAMIDVCEAR